MPKFTPPNLKNLEEDPTAAAIGGVGQTIQSLPQLYHQYKIARQKQAIEEKQLGMQAEELDLRRKDSEFNRGKREAIVPVDASKGTIGEPVLFAPGVNATAVSTGRGSLSEQKFRTVGTTRDGKSVSPTREGTLVVDGGERYNPDVHGEIQPLVAPTLGEKDIAEMEGLANSLTNLNRVKKLFRKESTGPVQARLADMARVTGVDLNLGEMRALHKDNTQFRVSLQSVINDYIKAVTGAQMSEPEAKRIMKALPSRDQADEAFMPALEETVRIMENKLDTKFTVLEAAGKRNVKDVKKAIEDKFAAEEGQGSGGPTAVPAVGETFNGAKVKSIKRIE